MAGAGNSANNTWASVPGYRPPQYTRVFEGESNDLPCDYAGAVTVNINGAPFTGRGGTPEATPSPSSPRPRRHSSAPGASSTTTTPRGSPRCRRRHLSPSRATEASGHGCVRLPRAGAGLCTPGARRHGRALVSVESAFNPWAIGVVGGALRQPRTRAEALATAKALQDAGWNFSVGLGQINVGNFEIGSA